MPKGTIRQDYLRCKIKAKAEEYRELDAEKNNKTKEASSRLEPCHNTHGYTQSTTTITCITHRSGHFLIENKHEIASALKVASALARERMHESHK